MKIVIYDTITKEISVKWKKLWEISAFANLTNSPEWFTAADNTYHYENKKIIAMFSESNELIGICGLVLEKIAGLSVWTCAAREFADKQPLLINYTHKKEVAYFVSSLEDIGFVYLTNIKKEYVTLFTDKHSASALYLDLNSYVDFSVGPYGNFKLQRATYLYKKIKREGHVLKTETRIAKKMEALDKAFAIENHSSKKQNGKAVFDNETYRTFYRTLIELIPQNVHIALILIDDKPICYSIDFINNGIAQGSQKAHLPEYNRYSPGRLLIMALCDAARENGETCFDFGRGVDDFKRSFITRSEEIYGVYICRNYLLRSYLKNIFIARNTAYEILVKLKTPYKIYRWVLKGVTHHG